eukprot:468835_1
MPLKPNDTQFREIQHIFDKSNHPELQGLDKKQKTQLASKYWKNLKRDKNWSQTLEELKTKHDPYLPESLNKNKVDNEALLRSRTMQQLEYRDIIISNHSNMLIFLCVRSQKRSVMSATEYNAASNSEMNQRNFGIGATAQVNGFGIGGNFQSGKVNKITTANSNNTGVKLAVSNFIEEQYNPIQPGKTRSFAVQGQIAYISLKKESLDNKNSLTDLNTLKTNFIWDGYDLNETQTAQYAKQIPHTQTAQYAQQIPHTQTAQYAQQIPHTQTAQYAKQIPHTPPMQQIPVQNVQIQMQTATCTQTTIKSVRVNKKPTNEEFKEIQHIFDSSNHPEFESLKQSERTKQASKYWLKIKKEANWFQTFQELKTKHQPYMSGAYNPVHKS